ncbi:MAG: aminoacyl-histidine dipeptidase [bacterium]
MANTLKGIEPQIVWDYFEKILQYPHPSKKEHKLAAYIESWAKEHNFELLKDKTGNLVVRKPATAGMEDRLPIAIQGHIDMVCEKNSDVTFDFENDPIQAYIDGDWITAKGTTLGADNGIGVAMGMAIMTGGFPHPDIELLCTLDEETGLTGAMTLSPDILKAKILINLDSEEDGAFTIGCAGGMNTAATYKYVTEKVPADSVAYEVVLKGMQGGHSGIEIHDGRANALKFCNRFLDNVMKKIDIRLSGIKGGSAHNAIPREAFAVVTFPATQENNFLAFVKEYDAMIKAEYKSKEPNIVCEAKKVELPNRVMSRVMQAKLISSFYAVQTGVYRMSPDIKGLVQTSTNFAVVETRMDEVFVLTSQRSSVETEKLDMAAVVRAAFELGGAEVKQGDGYPAWQPNMDSKILKIATDTYKKKYGHDAKIEAIHAGLECGLVGEKYPGMDMLSFGPNLVDVHSPDEKIQISSTKKCFDLLQEIINNIPKR